MMRSGCGSPCGPATSSPTGSEYAAPAPGDSAMTPFDSLAGEPRWVAWRIEMRGGKATKVPYAPKGGRAKAGDPSTWGTRAEADARARVIVNGHHSGGIGIELGDLGGDTYLAGFDLDSCIGED